MWKRNYFNNKEYIFRLFHFNYRTIVIVVLQKPYPSCMFYLTYINLPYTKNTFFDIFQVRYFRCARKMHDDPNNLIQLHINKTWQHFDAEQAKAPCHSAFQGHWQVAMLSFSPLAIYRLPELQSPHYA